MMRRYVPLLGLMGLVLAVGALAAERDKPLAVGDRAPDFTLMDQNSKPVKLAEVLARREAVVVAFYLKADSAG
jgi:hypothetical protein